MFSLIRSSALKSAPRAAFRSAPSRFMSSAPKPSVVSSEVSSFGWDHIGKMLIPVVTFAGVLYVTSPPDNFKPRITVGEAGRKASPLAQKAHDKPAEKHEEVKQAKPIEPTEEKKEQFTEIVAAENVVPSDASEGEAVPAPESVHDNNVDSTKSKPASDLIKVQYLLVGGGTASYSALKAIQEREPDADIMIITNELYPPYMRPPLSKELWFTEKPTDLLFKDWGGNERSMIYDPVEDYELVDGSVSTLTTVEQHAVGDDKPLKKPRLIMGHAAASMDVEAHTVTLDDGRKIKYSKVLLATGGRPKQLEVLSGIDKSKVSTFRTIEDLKRLDTVLKGSGKKLVVVGGGFLGSELACATARYGNKFGSSVTQVFPEDGNMGLVFPKYLSEWTLNKVKAEGVDVRTKNTVVNASVNEQDKIILKLSDGSNIEADHVVVAVGLEPSVELARASGLEIDEIRGGVVVNAELEARKNVFVAGDMTSYHDIVLGRRRIEHHDHAVLSGRWAGKNMTGAQKPYKHQSMFWSDLGPNIGYEAVGILDSNLPTIGVWAKASESDTPQAAVSASKDNIRSATVDQIKDSEEATSQVTLESDSKTEDKPQANPVVTSEYGKGVVFYLKNDKIVGVLMWNMFQRTAIAQKLIQEQRGVDDVKALAKLFNIHE